MFRATFTQRVFVVGLLTALLAGGHAFADDDDRGDRGGGRSSGSREGGGGGGGSGRSWSGGGNSSSRSMSSRSESGGSSRSFRGDSSSQSIQPRSFGGGSSRSFSERSNSSAPVTRSFEGRGSYSPQGRAQFSRPSEESSSTPRTLGGGQPSTRSFEGMRSGQNSGNSGSNFRSLPQGGNPDNSDALGNFSRGSDNPSNSSQYRRSSGSDDADANLSRELSARAFQTNPQLQRGDANQSIGEFNRSRGQSGDSQTQNRREYTAGRPTDDQVRDFLQLRREAEANQANQSGGLNNQSGNAELGARRGGGNFGRGDGNSNATDGLSGNARSENLRIRVDESQKKGDSAWARRFGGDSNRGDSNRGGESNRGDSASGDQTARTGDGSRDGDLSRRTGDANRLSDGRGENERNGRGDRDGRDFDNDGRNRDFGDRKFVDSKYKDWRKDAWRGDRGEGRDHRDWSGRWKDGDRFVAAKHIRDHWDGDHDDDDRPFRGGWWKDRHDDHGHHGHHGHWRFWDDYAHHHHRPYYWWNWSSAPLLTSWVSFGWDRPYYWDYGPGEYIYCYDNVIYVNGRWFQPAPIYYENTVVLAQRAPDFTPEQVQQQDWMPLGVFAVARDGVADMNVLVQLAVTKDGVIGGTVFNQATKASFAVEGTVDKETQRAVWTYTDETNARIVMETSVYNLTQPEATGLIHYGPDDIQVVQLVRLEQPDAGAAPATTGTGVLPAP